MVNKNLHRASEMSEWLRGRWREIDVDGSQKAIANERKQMETMLENKLAEDLLSIFEKAEGIKKLWPRNSFITEKIILFKDGSSFHKQEIYDRLKIIAGKAKNDIKVHENFIEALRLLFYYGSEDTGLVPREDAKNLIKKKEFFGIIWSTAVCHPLNRRLIGDLEKYLEVIEKWFDDKDFLARPAWWKALIADKQKPEAK